MNLLLLPNRPDRPNMHCRGLMKKHLINIKNFTELKLRILQNYTPESKTKERKVLT